MCVGARVCENKRVGVCSNQTDTDVRRGAVCVRVSMCEGVCTYVHACESTVCMRGVL